MTSLVISICWLLVATSSLARACIPGNGVDKATPNIASNAPEWSRCISARSTSSRLIICRYGSGCISGETKAPQTTFATEALCGNYVAKAICYDPTLDTNFGQCNDDFNCVTQNITKTIIVGGLTDPNCGEYIPTWKRCIKYGTLGGICRPYEANCAPGEVQSPTSLNARASGTLHARTTILQDCREMTPTYGCFNQLPYSTPNPVTNKNAWGWTCVQDTMQSCPTGVRIGTDVLYPTADICQSFVPVKWIKCKSNLVPDGTCMPYDPLTLAACPPGYLIKGNSGLFTSYIDCAAYNTYSLCYTAKTLQTSCYTGACPLGSTPVAEFNTSIACLASYTGMQYSRCINPNRNQITCVPSVAVTVACTGDPANGLVKFPSNNYDSLSACQSEDVYILCYSPTSNLLQCTQDYLGCDDIAPLNTYTRIFTNLTFSTRQLCVSYYPAVYRRCISIVTGVPKCRPADCLETEYPTYTADIFPTQQACEGVNKYLYCYNSSNPEVDISNCTLDKIGCHPSTTPIRSLSNGVPTLFDYSACYSYAKTGKWVSCSNESNGWKCRPEHAEITVDAVTGRPSPKFCAHGEELEPGTTTFTGLAECIASRP